MSWNHELFPFHNLTTAEILDLSLNSNTDCLCSAQLARAKLDSLPRFNILASISNVPHLSNLHPDLQIPSQTNFKYYSTHDFQSNYGIRNCSINTSLFALNCHIRSLQANFDNFCCTLTDLNLMFSVIGLSETKIKVNQDPLLNIEIPDYIFVLKQLCQMLGELNSIFVMISLILLEMIFQPLIQTFNPYGLKFSLRLIVI